MTKNKARRVESANARWRDSEVLSIEQKIANLDKRLGKGIGAVRERERLAKKKLLRDLVEVQPMKEPISTEQEVTEKPKKKAKERRKEDKKLRHKNKE